MNCPNCGREVSFQAAACNGCGQDLRIYRKIVSASNSFYNDGLKKAKVRDLSGAVVSLKKSLKLNKKNTDARNLLGLVYYEMGEMVAALSEWVISKNFQNDHNAADKYMDALQKNPARLETINQTIKKYNNALNHAKAGNGDLAVIQLEKVAGLNPNFIRNYQLLALLYMKQGQYKKAARCLSKAKKIDVNNTLTLYYMEQLPKKSMEAAEKAEEKKPPKKAEKKQVSSMQEETVILPKREGKIFQPETDIPASAFNTSSYKEDRFNIWPYLNLIIGAVLGIAVVYFLLVPTAKKSVAANYEKKFNEYTSELSAQSARVTGLENEKAALEKEKEELQEKLKALQADGADADTYSKFYKAIRYYMEGNEAEAAKQLSKVEESAIENKAAKEIYNIIKSATFEQTAEALAEEGRTVYNNGKYDEAVLLLNQALAMNPDNVKAVYFLGRCYQRKGEYDKAKEYYTMIVEEYPNSDRAGEAATRLKELQ